MKKGAVHVEMTSLNTKSPTTLWKTIKVDDHSYFLVRKKCFTPSSQVNDTLVDESLSKAPVQDTLLTVNTDNLP